MKKHFMLLALCAMLGLLFVGCASVPGGGAMAGLLGGGQPPVVMSEVNGASSKVGTAESKVVLGLFGDTSFPTIKTAADNAGITKIATVEYYSRPGILGFTTTYYTIVTGE